jgi:hypothetical protein
MVGLYIIIFFTLPLLCKALHYKGKVENTVGFVKKNFIRHRIYKNIDSWNEQCQKWLNRTGNGKIHNGTKRRPADVFLLEKQHMRQVNSFKLNNKNSIARSVRKDNTILYLSNRYSVPLGTFQKHPEVHIQPTEENNLVIYLQETGEILATHSISLEKGKLILNRSHQRDQSNRINELIYLTSNSFGDIESCINYLNELRERYPRYIRDQINLIRKCSNENNQEILDEALKICIERQLFSANDFVDVVKLIKRQRQSDIATDTAKDMNTLSIDIAELTHLEAEAEQRPLKEYVAIMEGVK